MRDQFGLNDPHADSFSVSDAASVSSRFDKVRESERGRERQRKEGVCVSVWGCDEDKVCE